MKQKIPKSEYLKLAGMLLVIIIFILRLNVIYLIKNDDQAPAVLFLTVAMITSFFIWFWMKRDKFKKQVFWSFLIAYWIFAVYMFFLSFNFRLHRIRLHDDYFVIFLTIILIMPFYLWIYRVGMRERKKTARDEESEPVAEMPIRVALTDEVIDMTKDDELLQLIFDDLIEKLPDDSDDAFNTIQILPKPQQAIYATWCFESELNNGGFIQYFSNYSSEFTDLLPEFFKVIGANQFADLHARASQIYQNNTIGEQNPLKKLDDEFFDIYERENLQQLQVNFIRANKISFIENFNRPPL